MNETISVDLILPEKVMLRVEASIAQSGLTFVGYVRRAVVLFGAHHRITFPEFNARQAYNGKRPGDGRIRPGTVSNPVRHAVTFPRDWLALLNKTAKASGLSKAAMIRVSVLRQVNGVK